MKKSMLHVRTECLGQTAEEHREEKIFFLFMRRILERARKVGAKKS